MAQLASDARPASDPLADGFAALCSENVFRGRDGTMPDGVARLRRLLEPWRGNDAGATREDAGKTARRRARRLLMWAAGDARGAADDAVWPAGSRRAQLQLRVVSHVLCR